MNTRRDLLRAGALVGTGALLSGCSLAVRRYTAPRPPTSVALPDGEIAPITRLLNRAAFGPTPGEVVRVTALGAAAYIEEQLSAGADEETHLALRLRGIDALRFPAMELRDLPEPEMLRQLQQAALLRAVYSPRQLRERMVDLWSNHFNIYARKGLGTFFKPVDELTVIRRHALTTFPELLRASARSPAMLAYLDNQANRRGVANENYARELMELHTLGVHGGYTQKDVQEVARCLTGWTVEDRFLRPRGTFRFDPARHDDGAKVVLGRRIAPGGGLSDGEQVLDLLATHPGTARFISGKICRCFLGEAPGPWPARLAAIYEKTGGDIKAMLRPLLLSDDLAHAPPLLKRPFDFVVSALRALNADTDGGAALQEHLARMGQPLYQWPMPDGYPDRASAWTGSLLARWNFAFALTAAGIPGTTVDLPRLIRAAAPADALLELALARPADEPAMLPVREKLRAHLALAGTEEHVRTAEAAALLLASPEFQWR